MRDFWRLLGQLREEPIADNVCIPLYFLAKLVRDSGTTVVQVGEGADENFLGYWWCEHYRKKAETVCWGAAARQQLTPRAEPFRSSLDCPVEGLLPESHCQLDSHAVVSHY